MSDALTRPSGVSEDVVVQRLDEAERALASIDNTQQAKTILDAIVAQQVFAERQRMSESVIAHAHRIKVAALSRLGELLRAMPRRTTAHSTGGGSKGSLREPLPSAPPTLADLGVDKKTSMVAQQLATLDPETRDQIANRETTLREVRNQQRRDARIERETSAAVVDTATAPAQVLLVDPPWQYEHVKTESRAVENQYPTMSHEALCGLDVDRFAAPDSVWFVWATSPKLGEAFELLAAWALTYRTCLVWVKDKIGMGYYARQQHELLLVATQGEGLAVPAPDTRPSSVIHAPRQEHSAKPPAVYDLIERMYPHASKRELFARSQRNGWLAAWGFDAPVR